jgi:hypothetical protein
MYTSLTTVLAAGIEAPLAIGAAAGISGMEALAAAVFQ